MSDITCPDCGSATHLGRGCVRVCDNACGWSADREARQRQAVVDEARRKKWEALPPEERAKQIRERSQMALLMFAIAPWLMGDGR